MAKQAVLYDEKTILTLDPLAHIRLRSGMYIGRIGNGSNQNDGIYVLLKEVVDNAIDEFIMGQGKKIEITLKGNTVSVRDHGRGIPLGKVIDCVSKMHTGGKYNDDVFQFSVGLNGVGTKAVNALAKSFEVCSWREGKWKRATFEQGVLKTEDDGEDPKSQSGTFVSFTPDPEIFGDYQWNEEFIYHRLRYYAYLNSGLSLVYNGQTFKSQGGLRDLLNAELGEEEPLYEVMHFKHEKLEIAFTHTHNYGETYYSFVNGQFTSDGGTHLAAFREGLLKGINEYAKKSFSGEDVRDGIIGAVAVKLQDPVFESQTKNKLGSTDVKSWVVPAVKDAVERWLHQHKEVAAKLITKIENNEKLRKELAAVKKQARERAKKTAIRIPKLIDCKIHKADGGMRWEESSLFLTEGDSAGGSLVQARDVDTQAIFSLKGKPLNVYGLKRDAIYTNEELYNIMRALGIEETIEGLRYNKIVIATDADVDGMHIRNLLLTYFLRYFEELVVRGHIYILETPLFRVRNKKETIYCYSEAECGKAIKKLGAQPEITRFKGLGEISPIEFKRFIGTDMRLVQVEISSLSEVNQALEFCMGKNTVARKDYIVDNLVMDVV